LSRVAMEERAVAKNGGDELMNATSSTSPPR
jgi:hypothetical protein